PRPQTPLLPFPGEAPRERGGGARRPWEPRGARRAARHKERQRDARSGSPPGSLCSRLRAPASRTLRAESGASHSP
ncbi:hypothetical protein HispidOSU_027047, partial [Sigmodon hispidus]